MIIGAAISAALFFLGRHSAGNKPPATGAAMNGKSIAVLPFTNFSADPDNEYFGDGVQDDILTNLAKIADLKVISRTSVAQYRGKAENVREIGKALGVATVLEGSVRKAGNRVRVNVQLINAQNDQHIWAEDYDRELTDVFAIQSDLAQKIAAELHAKLSPAETATLTQPPTANGEAYLAYIQAHNLRNTWHDRKKFKAAEELYARAIQLDAKFALAIAGESCLQSAIFHQIDGSATRAQRARELANEALALQPNLPEAHRALGLCYYYIDRDPAHYEQAVKEFDVAREGLPNDPDVYTDIAAVERRQGKWKKSTADHEKALQLDPKSSWVLHTLAVNYWFTRNWEAANRAIDRALQLDPRDFSLWSRKWDIIFAERGDFSAGAKLIEQMDRAVPDIMHSPSAIAWRASFYSQQRKWAEALRELETLPDSSIAADPSELRYKYDSVGLCKQELGDASGGHTALLRAREVAERSLTEAPGVASHHAGYAVILARLGDKEAAIREAKRAAELLPESSDALDGPFITEERAYAYALTGDADNAIELLTHLLQVPSPVTPAVLKASSDWDPLRGNPRFEKLCEN